MFEAIILGIVQGITEFFPVSSTAHLILFPWFFNWSGLVDTLTFDVSLHAGTLVALIGCFWRDWVEIISQKRKMLVMIIIGTIPAGTVGLLFNNIVEQNMRNPYIIVVSLVVVSIVMYLSEKMFKHKKINEISYVDAVYIGIAQAVALIPGVSRSGVTISAALFRSVERESAARFSFLLATPVIAGALLLHSKKILSYGTEYDYGLFAVGFFVSAAVGFVSIKFLLKFFKRYSLNLFVYYRFILALVIIIGIWLKG
jgi:undecaprenyl-diphosphatase